MERYPKLNESANEKCNNPQEIKYLPAELLKDSEVVESDNILNSTTQPSTNLLRGISGDKHFTVKFNRVDSRLRTTNSPRKVASDEDIRTFSMLFKETENLIRSFSCPLSRNFVRKESRKVSFPFSSKEAKKEKEDNLEFYANKALYKNLINPQFEAALVAQIQISSSNKIAKFIEQTRILDLVKISEKVSFALLTHSNLNSRTLIAKRLYNHFVFLSRQASGSRFLVAMIKEMGVRVKRRQIMNTIQESLKSMMFHKHGHRVILAIMDVFKTEDWESIVNVAFLNLEKLLKSPFGHKVVVKLVLLTTNKRDQQRFLNKLTMNSRVIFCYEFVEPVLSAVIASWKEEGLERVVNSICDEMFSLIKTEKGVGLVEKGIRNSPEVFA